jgi:hypothetical protein
MNASRRSAGFVVAMVLTLCALPSREPAAGVNNVCISCWTSSLNFAVGVSTNPVAATLSNAMTFTAWATSPVNRVWSDPCCNVSKANDVLPSGSVTTWFWQVIGNTAPSPASGMGTGTLGVAVFTNYAVGTGAVRFTAFRFCTISGAAYNVSSTGTSPTFIALELSLLETNILACVGVVTNAELAVTPVTWSNIAWQITPALSGGATFTTNPTGPGSATTWPATNHLRLSPGSATATYAVIVRAQDYTNCYDQAQVRVVGVELAPTGTAVCVGSASNAEFHVTLNSWTNVLWELTPTNLPGGASIALQTPTNVEIALGTVGTGYTVRARSADNTAVTDEAALDVIVLEIGASASTACACTSGCEVTFWLTNSYAPAGVTWSVEPDSLPGGASIVSTSATELFLQPGSVATSYTIRATAAANTNCYEETELDVVPIVVSPSLTNACACTNSCSVEFSVTLNAAIANGVFWGIEPSNLADGAQIIGATTTTVTVLPGVVGTSYTVFAWSVDNPSCVGTAGMSVLVVDIAQTGTAGCVQCSSACDITLSLTTNSYWGVGGVSWDSTPPGITGTTASIVFDPTTLSPAMYVVRAYSTLRTNCFDTCTVRLVKTDIIQSNAYAWAGATNNVRFNLPGGSWTNVAWTISPDLGANGASFASGPTGSGTSTNASGTNVWVWPGTFLTDYVVRAQAVEWTNCLDAATLTVCRVDIVQTNALALIASTSNVAYNLTSDSITNVTWTITPDLGTNGATFANGPTAAGTTNTWLGTNIWVSPGTAITSYVLTACGTLATNCQDTALFAAINIEIEPVTLRPGNGATFPLYNPCGIVDGQTAQFEVKVEPASIPDGHVIWTNTNGSLVPQGGGAGRIVTVEAEGMGIATLRVDIVDLIGTAPTIQTEGLEAKTVKVFAWIVRKDDGTDPATTQARVIDLIEDANDIFAQVAMTLVLEGAIKYTNRTDWLDVEQVGGAWPEADAICAITNGTGGVEMYFMDTIEGATGLNGSDGLLLSDNANFRTTAHEIGHTSGLKDIYVSGGGSNVIGAVTSSWEPDDWNSGPGPQYYNRTLSQEDLVKRLLMYGVYSDTKSDIPRGKIHGVWYEWQLIGGTWTQVWHLSLDAVGLSDMGARQPTHN